MVDQCYYCKQGYSFSFVSSLLSVILQPILFFASISGLCRDWNEEFQVAVKAYREQIIAKHSNFIGDSQEEPKKFVSTVLRFFFSCSLCALEELLMLWVLLCTVFCIIARFGARVLSNCRDFGADNSRRTPRAWAEEAHTLCAIGRHGRYGTLCLSNLLSILNNNLCSKFQVARSTFRMEFFSNLPSIEVFTVGMNLPWRLLSMKWKAWLHMSTTPYILVFPILCIFPLWL